MRLYPMSKLYLYCKHKECNGTGKIPIEIMIKNMAFHAINDFPADTKECPDCKDGKIEVITGKYTFELGLKDSE